MTRIFADRFSKAKLDVRDEKLFAIRIRRFILLFYGKVLIST